jgi:hypothetical protein
MVIEPSVRCIAIEMDAEALAMPLQAIAKSADVVHRNEMVSLAEHAEDGTIDRGDGIIEGARILVVDRPFARLGRAVPHECRTDAAPGGDEKGQPCGLAHAHDGEPAGISLRDHRQHVDDRFERCQRVGIGDVTIGVATVERLLVRMREIKVRSGRDEAIGRKALREIAGVRDESVALVDHDHAR